MTGGGGYAQQCHNLRLELNPDLLAAQCHWMGKFLEILRRLSNLPLCCAYYPNTLSGMSRQWMGWPIAPSILYTSPHPPDCHSPELEELSFLNVYFNFFFYFFMLSFSLWNKMKWNVLLITIRDETIFNMNLSAPNGNTTFFFLFKRKSLLVNYIAGIFPLWYFLVTSHIYWLGFRPQRQVWGLNKNITGGYPCIFSYHQSSLYQKGN